MLDRIKQTVLVVIVASFFTLLLSSCGNADDTNKGDTNEFTNEYNQTVEYITTNCTTTETIDDTISEVVSITSNADVTNAIDNIIIKPTTTKPTTTKPTTTKPTTTKPTTTKPVTTKPVTTKPVATKPVTTKPVATKPVTTKPTNVQTTNDNSTKRWFVAQYEAAKQQYINEINKLISAKQAEMDACYEQRSSFYSEYSREVRRTKEEFANMGLTNSGAEKTALRNLEANYKKQVDACDAKIDQIRSEIDELKDELADPNVDEILVIVSENCGITWGEARNYYISYIK